MRTLNREVAPTARMLCVFTKWLSLSQFDRLSQQDWLALRAPDVLSFPANWQ